MNKDNLPIIDWVQATKLAGNKTELAEEMFKLFLMELPTDLECIKNYSNAKNYSDLLRAVHKLHGVLCYCGLPRLKSIVEDLEKDLKDNFLQDIPTLVQRLNTEVDILLLHNSRFTL